MRMLKGLAVFFTALVLTTSCATVPAQEVWSRMAAKVDAVQVGMTKDQVYQLLGSPTNATLFPTDGGSKDLWVYNWKTVADNTLSARDRLSFRGSPRFSPQAMALGVLFVKGVVEQVQRVK